MCCSLAVLAVVLFFFFFFKQKTAYEIVSRDWSSDVCSSDLVVHQDLTAKMEPQDYQDKMVLQDYQDVMERMVLPVSEDRRERWESEDSLALMVQLVELVDPDQPVRPDLKETEEHQDIMGRMVYQVRTSS